MPLMNDQRFYFIIQDSDHERVDDLVYVLYNPTERKIPLEFEFRLFANDKFTKLNYSVLFNFRKYFNGSDIIEIRKYTKNDNILILCI